MPYATNTDRLSGTCTTLQAALLADREACSHLTLNFNKLFVKAHMAVVQGGHTPGSWLWPSRMWPG